MSFDMRQNVLMVRSLINGQPFYNFYNAMGLEFTLAGYQLKEIYDCHYEGAMRGIITYWGFSNKATRETFEFSSRGDLMWNVSLNNTCHTLLPFEMIIGHEGFNVVNGFMIEDHVRNLIKIHQKAVGRSVERSTWFEKMSDHHMRELLAALGHGPMRVENADKDELIKIHTEWQRKHDAEFKYTHDAIGLDHDQKIPADLYDDHGRRITRRMMANHKTVDMMAEELSNLIRIFKLNPNYDHKDPSWELGLVTIANCFIYAENAKEALDNILEDRQFVVNGVYALARDYDWIRVNEETEDYQQSLIRRLLQELRNDIEAEDSIFVLEDGVAYIKAVSATAQACGVPDEDVVDEEEDEDEDEAEAERESRKYPAVNSDMTIDYETIRKILNKAKVPASEYRGDLHSNKKDVVRTTRKKIIVSLRDAVHNELLGKLAKPQLETLARSLTKLKDGDRYPRDKEYLKELIKHALF